MKNLNISASILLKLKNEHQVVRKEVEQCFANKCGRLLFDNRPKHKTNPPTMWFIAPTNTGRPLKIVYMQLGLTLELKSAFDPNEEELRIYRKYG